MRVTRLQIDRWRERDVESRVPKKNRMSATTERKVWAAFALVVACVVGVGVVVFVGTLRLDAKAELTDTQDILEQLRVLIVGGGILAGTAIGIALFSLRRDFADHVRAERAMQAAQADLEARVGERTQALERAARELKEEIEARRHTERKLQSKLQRLDLLQQITRAIGERQDLQSILQVVNGTLENQLPADFCCVCLHEAADSLSITCVGPQSLPLAKELALTPGAALEIERNGLSRCLHGQVVYEPDLREVKFPFMQLLARGGLGAVVAAPLVVESTVFGVQICARVAQATFSSGDREFLKQLSEQVALAAHHAKLHGALQKAYDELQQTQSAALQQERLLALGQMASGIAHDINNTLAPVALYMDALRGKEAGLSSDGQEHIERVWNAISSVMQTLKRMRAFYRPGEPSAAIPLDLNALIRDVIELTQPKWASPERGESAPVDIRTELAADLPPIMGYESELRDALVNLIFNAVDAMPDGGSLTLRTAIVEEPGSGLRAVSRFIRFELADSGVGMDESTRSRCMEPFFTTKGRQGTGLGLAMVYGTMQRHGSDIEIESEPGAGTTLRFNFPAPRAPSGEVGSFEGVPLPPLPILVVDDDALVASAVCEMLEREGHRASVAAGGQAAIDGFLAAQSRGAPFRAVITDLSMPQVDGFDVCSAVKAAAPGTVVIMLTGWGQQVAQGERAPCHVDCVLCKPPLPHELRAALSRCICN
jgi:signal transduction histidine kinase